MKNFKFVLAAFALSLVVACDDAIDITQPSELLPEDTFETVDDLDLGLNGVYGAVPGENAIYFTSTFTDEVAIGIANGGQGLSGELAFVMNNNNGSAASIWVSNYSVINLANRLIAGAEYVIVEEGSDEAAQKANILAQARVLRAYAHFTLLSYFSPDLTDDSALGVIALDYVPDAEAQLPRNTNGEVFALIESDLAYAEDNIIDIAIIEKKRIGLNAIKAFRARMAAYREQYELAKQYVDELDALYSPTNKNNYPAIWIDNITTGSPNESSAQTGVAASEVIFALERSNSGSTGNFYQVWASLNSTVNGSPFFEVNRALFNLVNFTGDVRRKVIVDASAFEDYIMTDDEIQNATDEQYENGDILPVGKYTVTESLNLLGDIKVFRFSEMMLIRAEYYASVGDFANVTNEINHIRQARYGSATAGDLTEPITTAQQAWLVILRERRAELAFEGHRYLDIKRLGTKAGEGVVRFYRDCAFNNQCTLSADDYRFTLPIPRAEQSANPSIQQNPGYGNTPN